MLQKSIQDEFGNSLKNNEHWQFHTQKDIYPPQLQHTNPVADRRAGRTTAKLWMRLSQDVDAQTINTENIIVKANGKKLNGTIQPLNGQANVPQWVGAEKEFPPNAKIEVTLKNIKDKAGNLMGATSFSFETPSGTRVKWR